MNRMITEGKEMSQLQMYHRKDKEVTMTELPDMRGRRDGRRFHRVWLTAILAVGMLLAGLPSPGGTPAAQAQNEDSTGWYVNDDPEYNGDWQAGDPASKGKGYGAGKYWGNSNYIYTNASVGTDSVNQRYAVWKMGRRSGFQEIQAYVPSNHSTASVKYIIVAGNRRIGEQVAHQADISGWTSLGNWPAVNAEIQVEVHYSDSKTAAGKSGAFWRSIGVDALRMRCVSDCGATPPPGEPGPVRNLKLALTDHNSFKVTWDRPSNTGGSSIARYLVNVSRPGWSSPEYRGWSSGHTFNGRDCVTYTLQIRAQNSADRIGPSVSARIATEGCSSPPPGEPGPVRNLKLALTDHNSFKVTWDRPSNTGGSSIARYLVNVSRPGWSSPEYRGWSSGHTFNGRDCVTYTLQIRAQNSADRIGPSVSARVTTQGCRPPSVCNLNESRNKFRIINTGFLGRDRRVQALQSFTTLDKQRVRAGDVGGKVKTSSNLSQNGCSWIFGNAVVNDTRVRVFNNAIVDGTAVIGGKAKIYENAHVRGNAKVRDARVYGDADLYGNKAVVYGNARVYGNADVYGAAHVFGSARAYGSAKIRGEARVSGSARVRGTAVIEGKMSIDSGIYDGRVEYDRVAQEIYDEVFDELVDDLKDCPAISDLDDAKRTARTLLNPSASYWDKQIAEAVLLACKQLGFYRDLAKVLESIVKPGLLDFLLLAAGPLAKAGKLSVYVAGIVELVGELDKFRKLYPVFYENLEDALQRVRTK